MALTQDQRNFFTANGYLKYGKILDDETVAMLRCEYDKEFEKAAVTDNFRNLAAGDGKSLDEKNEAPVQMLQIMQMCERNIAFRRLVYNEAILDIVSELLGPNIMLFHDQALFKPAHTGGPVFWHQDNAYWKCSPANLISCWMTLDDVNIENGAMQVIPGSHLSPMLHESSESTNALLDISKQVDESKAVAIDLPAGGCMFHHCQTLHYTQANQTDRQRRAFAIHFMTPGTTENYAGTMMHVGFHRPMLRMSI